jgi:peptide-methionine (R)-S-oxide reductase
MTDIVNTPLSRRRFFATSSAAALSLGAASTARAATEPQLHGSDMTYEITKTEEEWRAQLNEFEYEILRNGRTEKPKTSPLWEETAEGSYHCKGCELKAYEGRWKSNLDKGWVFFFHSEPDAVLTGIDGAVAEYGQMSAGFAANIEVHCRRCGSHLGHIIYVEDLIRHCINGTALNFHPASA